MGHKHNQHKKKKRRGHADRKHQRDLSDESHVDHRKCLELLLKCDSEGSREAIISSLSVMNIPGVDMVVMSSGVGDINKSDLFMAGTASGLIVGYEVKANKALEREIYKVGVEVRLYKVIYRLLEDLKEVCTHLVAEDDEERILGRAKVIRLFKSCRKGIILGCEVLEGRLARGDRFRIIGAMGQIYNGRLGSLHIDRDAVDSAGKGRQVGLKIEDFKKATVGDYVECVKYISSDSSGWKPVPGIKVIT